MSPRDDPSRGLPADATRERLVMLAADLDDETPEVLAVALERALAEGALDAVCVPVTMKKGRPGHRIEVLARPEDADRLVALLLRETATLGVRVTTVERIALAREETSVQLDGHTIRIKWALWEGEALRAKPELEDCRAVAQATGRPLREIVEQARQLARRA